MRSYIALALAGLMTLAGAGCSQQTPLQKAAALLGAEQVKTVQVVASGTNFSVGQNYTAADPWPRVTVKNYTALDQLRHRQHARRTGARNGRGDAEGRRRAVLRRAAPGAGRQRQLRVERAVPPAMRRCARQRRAAAQSGRSPRTHARRLVDADGFVKGAMANNATRRRRAPAPTCRSRSAASTRLKGTINAQGQVEKVRTWIDQPIVGDMLVETTYIGYKDFGGVLLSVRASCRRRTASRRST